MSHAGAIVGISELEVEQVDRNKGIEVWARPTSRPFCKHCGCSSLRVKATHRRTVKHSRQGNQVMTLHLQVPKYHCRQCGRYFRHDFVGIRPRYRASEAYRLEVFEAHDGGITQRKISHTHRISPATVERWYRYHVCLKKSEMSERLCPKVLGIDEHFFTRKKGYATTFVDLRSHRVFDVKLGRSEASLRHYLRALRGKENVQVMVMDLSETYRNIARNYFPQATIVADRFHVVRLINHHFLKVWQQHDSEGRKNRGLISLMRRHQWRLSDEQHANLMTYLAQYPVLQTLYVIKQRLVRFMLLRTLTARRARKKLPKYLALLSQLKESPLRVLAKTLESWMEPIIAMWRFSKSNGITEGFHNKMEMMSRRAYGFRNFENYRLRVLTHCGWDGIINRVR
ncbi:ISL3 family transposase [Aestuariirhabdus sp. Z084]|uniref:ISL3 family transposase n=1 Tax=Aestuariirhabdus haliotis TaxID=2918751 RepID=UPI0020C08F1B|nr:ISL3 family transposase [Aestuariirhabdus haliotis]MCL6417260.1 ISL3 family transposase [Aestuariirhabdus haliotis]